MNIIRLIGQEVKKFIMNLMALINSKLHLWYELDDTFYDFVKI
jgi:hypothetical protein